MDNIESSIHQSQAVAAAIDAEVFFEPEAAQGSDKPRLLVNKSSPHETVAALRDILAEADALYDRGVPARVAFDKMQKGVVAEVLSPWGLIMEAHQACRPYAKKFTRVHSPKSMLRSR